MTNINAPKDFEQETANHLSLTNFNYLYRIVFQCDTNYFHRHLPQKLNFLKKFLYYIYQET